MLTLDQLINTGNLIYQLLYIYIYIYILDFIFYAERFYLYIKRYIINKMFTSFNVKPSIYTEEAIKICDMFNVSLLF